jgi:hypothetical protein
MAGSATGTNVLSIDNFVANGTTTQSPPPSTPVVAQDTFSRTMTGGWGTADTGGEWTASVPTAITIAGGVATTVTSPGTAPTQYLKGVSETDVDVSVDFMAQQLASAPYAQTLVALRSTATSQYRAKVNLLPNGKIELALSKVSDGSEVALSTVQVSGVTYAPGQWLTIRASVSGTTSVKFTGTVWARGATEPPAQATATDVTSPLSGPGFIGVKAFMPGAATGTNTISFDNFTAKRLQ